MMRFIEAGRLRRLGVVLLTSMLASRSVGARAQDVTPSIPALPDAPRAAATAADSTNQKLLDAFLKKMEDRLDQVTKQNEQLSREVQELRRVNRNGNADVDAAVDVIQPNSGMGGGSPGSILPPVWHATGDQWRRLSIRRR